MTRPRLKVSVAARTTDTITVRALATAFILAISVRRQENTLVRLGSSG